MPHFVPTRGRSLPGALPWPAQPGLAWPFKADLAGPQVRMTRGEGGGDHVGRGQRDSGSRAPLGSGLQGSLFLAPLACSMISV